MADETTTDTAAPADKPLATLVEAEKSIDLPAPAAPPSPAEMLRSFEDELFGADAVRIGGQIERGSGSAFSLISPANRRRYIALERSVLTERQVADAQAALVAAEAEHAAALVDVDVAAPESKPEGEA